MSLSSAKAAALAVHSPISLAAPGTFENVCFCAEATSACAFVQVLFDSFLRQFDRGVAVLLKAPLHWVSLLLLVLADLEASKAVLARYDERKRARSHPLRVSNCLQYSTS